MSASAQTKLPTRLQVSPKVAKTVPKNVQLMESFSSVARALDASESATVPVQPATSSQQLRNTLIFVGVVALILGYGFAVYTVYKKLASLEEALNAVEKKDSTQPVDTSGGSKDTRDSTVHTATEKQEQEGGVSDTDEFDESGAYVCDDDGGYDVSTLPEVQSSVSKQEQEVDEVESVQGDQYDRLPSLEDLPVVVEYEHEETPLPVVQETEDTSKKPRRGRKPKKLTPTVEIELSPSLPELPEFGTLSDVL